MTHATDTTPTTTSTTTSTNWKVFMALKAPVTLDELRAARLEDIEEFLEGVSLREDEMKGSGGNWSFYQRQRQAAEAELSRRGYLVEAQQ